MTRTAIGTIALILALVLVVAGALTLAGSRYIDGNIHDQLVSQKISFAPKGSPGLPADIQSYGGTAVTNGAQAKVFSDQYIAVHVSEAIDTAAKADPELKGMTTYSEVSGLARSHPANQNLSNLVDTVFKGQMLRSSLLSAWGWGTLATIMFWVALSAFGAAILLTLAGLSLVPVLASRLGIAKLLHPKGHPAAG